MPRAPCRSPVWNGLPLPGARCPSVPRLTFDAELFIAGALLGRRSTPARTRYCSIPSGNCTAMRCPRDESGVSTRQCCRSPRSSRRRTPRGCQHSPSQHPGQLRADAAGRWQPRRGEEPRRSQTGLAARGRPRAAPLLQPSTENSVAWQQTRWSRIDKLGGELHMIRSAFSSGIAIAAPLFGGYPAFVVSNWPSIPVIGGMPTRHRAGSNGGQSWIKPRLLPSPPRVDAGGCPFLLG